MRKRAAIFSTIMLLFVAIMTGCSTQASTTPAPSVSKVPVKSTIGPTATVNITLYEDTQYDESNFSVIIPSGAVLRKNGSQYLWTIIKNNYAIALTFYNSGNSINTSYFTESESNLAMFVQLMNKTYPQVTFQTGYKSITVDGKKAILLSGKYVQDAYTGTFEVYVIDSDAGTVMLFWIKSKNNSSDATQKEMDDLTASIFNTIKIK